jgi:hypothetical protein
MNEEGDVGTTFILYSDLEDKNDSFKENVSLIIQNFKNQKLTLEQYSQSSIKKITRLVSNSKIVSNSKSESNGKEFQKIIYTGTQGNLNLQFTQCIWIHKQEVYILTYACELSKVDKYKFKSDKILESFYLKGNQ